MVVAGAVGRGGGGKRVLFAGGRRPTSIGPREEWGGSVVLVVLVVVWVVLVSVVSVFLVVAVVVMAVVVMAVGFFERGGEVM